MAHSLSGGIFISGSTRSFAISTSFALHVECKMSGGGPPFFDDRSMISVKRTGTKDDTLTARMPTITRDMWHIIKLDRKES